MIMADQPGNDRYGRATQGANLSVPAQLKEGIEQSINFPAIADQIAGIKSVQLNATSTSGLPVQYYIKSGPAIMKDDQLVFTEIPVKSKYPVKVTVVACQWGRITTPLYQSAKSVTREFYITKDQ
jgi:hypothetical protein